MEAPKLTLTHSPGFLPEPNLDGYREATELFASEESTFGFSFSVFYWAESPEEGFKREVTGALDQVQSWEFSNPEALLDLGAKTETLKSWVDDCAKALEFLQEKYAGGES